MQLAEALHLNSRHMVQKIYRKPLFEKFILKIFQASFEYWSCGGLVLQEVRKCLTEIQIDGNKDIGLLIFANLMRRTDMDFYRNL